MLEAVEIVHRSLRMRGSVEDGALVVLQRREPGSDIRSVILADFRCKI